MFGTHSLTLFVVTGLALNVLPGPDSLLVMTHSARQGWRAGSVAALGIGSGTMVHIVTAALGLSALLASSSAAFSVVKYAGAAYILYLAFGLLKRKDKMPEECVATERLPLRKIYAQGMLTNVLNPKVALFFIAFLPQYIDQNAPGKVMAFLFLGGLFNLNGMLWCHCLAVFTAKASDRIKLSPRLASWLSRATGGLFIWIGIKLALSRG